MAAYFQLTSYVTNATPAAWHAGAGLVTPCAAMLNTSDAAAACIRVQEVDPSSPFGSAWFAHPPHGSAQTLDATTGRLCLFSYACAAPNVSVFSDPVNLS
jgi:hypothetical protein